MVHNLDLIDCKSNSKIGIYTFSNEYMSNNNNSVVHGIGVPNSPCSLQSNRLKSTQRHTIVENISRHGGGRIMTGRLVHRLRMYMIDDR